MSMGKYTDKQIIAEAQRRGIEYDETCMVDFVRENESCMSLEDIVDEYEDLIGY